MIKGIMIKMVTSIEADTNNILQITNLFNKFPMYTIYKEGDSQTLRNDENFKYIHRDSFKYNRYIICIYLNIPNLHFKPSLKPEIFEDISEYSFPTSGPTSGSGNSNPGTSPGTKTPPINFPPNLVTAI